MPHFIAQHAVVFGFLVICGCLLVGAARNALVEAIAALLNFIASPFVALCLGIRRFLPTLTDWIHRTLRALTIPDQPGRSAENWAGWDIMMPMIWAALFVVLVLSDLYVADLRMAALLGVKPYLASVRLPVDLFLAVTLVSVAAAFAFALPELRNSTLSHRPWASLNDDDRQRLMKLCAAGLGMTFMAALVLWAWGALQRGTQTGVADVEGGLAWLFWILLALPMLGATALAGWAALASPAALLALFLMVLRAALHLLEGIFRGLVWILDKLAELITLLLDVPARLGAGVLNAVGKRLPQDWRFEIVFVERPQIGAELDGAVAAPQSAQVTGTPPPRVKAPASASGNGAASAGPIPEGGQETASGVSHEPSVNGSPTVEPDPVPAHDGDMAAVGSL